MKADVALRKLRNLQRHCRARGIPCNLTLKDWVEAWGDQIDQRGVLQLQRIERDKGYVVGNLRVGKRP